jgi:hypothetical protein
MPLVCSIAGDNVDSIPAVINFRLAEDFAMSAFKDYLCDGERIGLRIAPKRETKFIANRNPGWQHYVVISSARGGDEPVKTFGQNARACRPDRLDCVRLSRSGAHI